MKKNLVSVRNNGPKWHIIELTIENSKFTIKDETRK